MHHSTKRNPLAAFSWPNTSQADAKKTEGEHVSLCNTLRERQCPKHADDKPAPTRNAQRYGNVVVVVVVVVGVWCGCIKLY